MFRDDCADQPLETNLWEFPVVCYRLAGNSDVSMMSQGRH